MKGLRAILLLLPPAGIAWARVTCNSAAIYLRDTKVLLTSFSIGGAAAPPGFPACGERSVGGNLITGSSSTSTTFRPSDTTFKILTEPGKRTFRIAVRRPHTTFKIQNHVPGKETVFDGNSW